MFETVLIANRGEIACRIIATLKSLGIRSAAVYSDPDAGARHVLLADVAVRLGMAQASDSYLNIEKIIDAAIATGAQAIHPGYGFLAENAAFAQACADALGLPIETDPRLMEFGSGALSPFTLAEMIELAPYDDIWHPHDAAWDGETIGAFWQRTGEAAEAIWQAGGRPLVVSHVGTTQGILRWTMRIPPDAPDSFSLFVGNASLTEVVVRVDRHGRRRAELHRLGSAEHLSNVTDI